MSENNLPASEAEQITAEASAAVGQGVDIRQKVRDLTLRALKGRQLDTAELKQVIRAVAEGISIGAGKYAGEAKSALADGLAGLDDALRKLAEATQLALRQLVSQGKDFTGHDLKAALGNFKRLEEDFLSTVSQVADAAGGIIRQELQELVSHARRVGTDTGAIISATVSDLSNRLSATLRESKNAGEAAAREISKRLALLTSGILSGMADALHEKAKTDNNKKAD